jgi:hypothetical protein
MTLVALIFLIVFIIVLPDILLSLVEGLVVAADALTVLISACGRWWVLRPTVCKTAYRFGYWLSYLWYSEEGK